VSVCLLAFIKPLVVLFELLFGVSVESESGECFISLFIVTESGDDESLL